MSPSTANHTDIPMNRKDMDEAEEPFLPPPASAQQAKVEKQHPVSLIAAVVTFYFIISLSVVFLNKIIMSGSSDFPYALFVTWYQLVVALVLLLVWAHLGKTNQLFSIIPPYEFDTNVAKRVAPLTFIYVGMLALNNLCLKYVEVTFYQVARSLSINFSILFTYVILKKKTSRPALFACFVVFLGFLIGSYGEINFSWAGVFYGVGSSAFVALYGIFVQKTLPAVDNNQWKLLHYNTTLAIIFLSPLVIVSGELGEIITTSEQIYSLNFWILMTITGITGFGINIAMFLQVKYTSALTNTISGTAKSCVQTILAAMIFQNEISGLNALGIFLALFGSSYYGWVRYQERIARS
ncbi:triose-phosphate transporter family-domain-containing protein [Mycotypha africana]|uniref:triose-phosphate transporter family-domain-containing protein n=1 Tax=Mycotypha africana TaxID=64632 RepID=UPI002301CD6D|nr:triose-phosphate transporter family-domain-containing protein [Mycotypha africana]KAI8970126.1 triose-phosphate transporter family-domain-containing protein [Mycotypha africana]